MTEEKLKLLKVAGIAWVGGMLCGTGLYQLAASRAIAHMRTSNKLMFQAMVWCMEEGFELPTAEARNALVERMEYIGIVTMTMAEDLGHDGDCRDH